MSSHEPSARLLSRSARALVAVAALLCLGGCFKPLYGDLDALNANSTAATQPNRVVSELEAVRVDEVQGYLGHELRNELDFQLAGGRPVDVKRYRLVVVPSQVTQGAVVDTLFGRSEASTIALSTNYSLFEIGKPAALTTGRVITSVSYDRTQQRFAAVRAERDAQERGAKVMADQIRTQLAAFFSSRA